MKYLSDIISVDINEPTYKNKYINYKVYRFGSPESSQELIFTGRMYVTKDVQKLYLNDIINSYTYDHKYIRPVDETLAIPENNDNPIGVLQRFVVTVTESGKSYSTDIILSMHQNPMSNKGYNILLGDIEPSIDNVLYQNTDLLPRIPNPYDLNLTNKKINMWVGALLVFNNKFIEVTQSTGNNISIYNANADKVKINPVTSYHNSNNISAAVVNSLSLSRNRSQYSKYLMIEGFANDVAVSPKVIAEYDQCPAEYYVIWMDRSGAYQCQPFSKKNTYTEQIESKSVINMLDEERHYKKQVSYSWDLNSDWITYEQKDAFESMLTSPYIYLFNTELNKGFWVLCRESNWVKSNKHNQNRPFNFNIKLETIKKQNIVY